jgi:hypothetical protein
MTKEGNETKRFQVRKYFIEVRRSQLQVIPFKRVFLISSRPTTGYELSGVAIPYRQENFIWFSLTCSDEHRATELAHFGRKGSIRCSDKTDVKVVDILLGEDPVACVVYEENLRISMPSLHGLKKVEVAMNGGSC